MARLADHAEQAADAPSALEFATAAGDSARALKAHREAAFQYGRALRFAAGATDEELLDLLEKCSYERYLIDDLPQAIDASTRAVELARRTGRPICLGRNLTRLSRLSWTSGLRADAEAAADEALSVLQAGPPTVSWPWPTPSGPAWRWWRCRTTQAVEWGQRALDLGDALGERAVQANALNTMGTARWFMGDAEGENLLLRSLQISLDDNRDDDVARAYTNLSGGAKASLELAKSRDYLDRGIAYCIQHDLDSSRLCMLSDHVTTLVELGEWEAAELQALELLDRLVLSRITRIPAVVVLALVRARRGEPGVWELLDEALAHAAMTQETQFLAPVAAARAEARWLGGEAHLVAGEVRSAYELAVSVEDWWYIGQLGVWLWRAGESVALPSEACPRRSGSR